MTGVAYIFSLVSAIRLELRGGKSIGKWYLISQTDWHRVDALLRSILHIICLNLVITIDWSLKGHYYPFSPPTCQPMWTFRVHRTKTQFLFASHLVKTSYQIYKPSRGDTKIKEEEMLTKRQSKSTQTITDETEAHHTHTMAHINGNNNLNRILYFLQRRLYYDLVCWRKERRKKE